MITAKANRADRLRARAARLLAGHVFGDLRLAHALADLKKAERIDHGNRETAVLFGKVCFQLQRWDDAVRCFRAALKKKPRDRALRALLREAACNRTAAIGKPMMRAGLYSRAEVLEPPEMHLRAPDIKRPAPFNENAPSYISAAWGRFQEFVGTLLGAFVSLAIWVVRQTGLYRGNRDAWRYRDGPFGLYGLLTLAAVREDLNEKLRQDPYPAGELTAHQRVAQKRPDWTKSLPTANGSWRTDDPMEGAALSRFNRSGEQPIERFKSRMSSDLPNVLAVARDLMHVAPGKVQELAPFLNLSYAAHIQAQAHDWMSHGENATGELWNIEIPVDHPARAQGLKIMSVRKTQPDPNPTRGRLTFANEVTHWWDASHVYGSDQQTCDRLRKTPDGTVLPGGELYLECLDGKPDLRNGFFRVNPGTGVIDSGFTRNLWVGTAAEHLLYARHHNWVCAQLRGRYPDHPWTSDQLYGVARLIVAAVQAKIHTVEWTTAVLPNKHVVAGLNTAIFGLFETTFKPFGNREIRSKWEPKHPILGGLLGGRRDNHGVRHGFSEEFESVYRLHEALVDNFEIRGVADLQPREVIPLPATRGKAAGELLRTHGLATILNSFGCQKGGALVGNNVPNWAVQMSIEGQSFIDIAAIDLLRDRERGIPGYNDARKLFGYPPLESYDELCVDADVKAKLEKHYGHAPEGLYRMDLQVGMLHDRNRPDGFAFDDFRFRLFIHAAASRLEQDPFFNELYEPEVYTDWGLQHIEEMNRRKLILLHCPELKDSGLAGVNNPFEPWSSTARSAPQEHPLTSQKIERYSPKASEPVEDALSLVRIYDTQGKRHYLVEDGGPVYTHRAGERLLRKDVPADPQRDPVDELRAAVKFFDAYFLAPFCGIATNDGRFVSRGRLNSRETGKFNSGEGIPGRRPELEEHLGFFDHSPADGVITLRENFVGWRALGYGTFAAAVQAFGSGLVFGRIRDFLAIDIARIGEKRSGSDKRTRIYDDAGELDAAWLKLFLDDFDKAAQASRTLAISHDEALEIVQRYAAPGAVSRRQFGSLFKVCTRLNNGKTITREQFQALFEGTFLVMAASFPERDGRAGIERLLAKN